MLSLEERIIAALVGNGKVTEIRCGHRIERHAVTELVSDAIGTRSADRQLVALAKAVLEAGDADIAAIATRWLQAVIAESLRNMEEGQQAGARYEFSTDGDRKS